MAIVIVEDDIFFQNIRMTQDAIRDARQALDQAIHSLHTAVDRRQVVHTAKDILLQAMRMILVPLDRLSAIKRNQGREIPTSIKESGEAVIQQLTMMKQMLRDVLARGERNTNDTIEIQNRLIEIQNRLIEMDRQYSEIYNHAMSVTEQMNVEGGRRRKRTMRKRTPRRKQTLRMRKRTYRK